MISGGDATRAQTVRPAGRRGRTRSLVIATVIAVGFGLCALVTGAAIGLSNGLLASVVGVLLAIIPLGIVLPAFLWLDRYEAEPPRLLWFAFAWGALVATAFALIVNTGSLAVIAGATGQDPTSVGAVAVAPVVEELGKGMLVVIVALWQRREFNGVVDGLVYAGVCGAGFAFAENVMYLGHAFRDFGGEGVVATFVLRGLVGPFGHPLFTCCTGVAVGLAVRRRSAAARVALVIIGWLCAVGLHAAWNLSSIAGVDGFATAYLALQVPIFVAFVSLAVWARQREGEMIGRQLTRYAAAGWFAPHEVQMLASLSARRSAAVWAQSVGGRAGARAMRRFQDSATTLATLRSDVDSGRAGPDTAQQERDLLVALTQARHDLGAAAETGPRSWRPQQDSNLRPRD